MSLQSVIGGLAGAKDNVNDAILAQARARLENIVGNIGAGLSNFFI